MQSQVSAREYPANAGVLLSLRSAIDGAPAKRQMAEPREARPEHQANPPAEIEWRGVPYSALNE